MKLRSLLLVFLTLAALSSCAKEKDKKQEPVIDPSPVSSDSSSGRIFFDASLTPKERGALVTSLAFLESNQLLNSDQRLLNVMKINRGDAATVRQWLEDRVQYVINDQTPGSKLVEVNKKHRFENPGVLPPAMREGAGKEGSIVMSNLGALFYLMGKKKGELFGIQADGLGVIPFSSPRAGILMIGNGLLGVVDPSLPNAVRAFQLATLLHEARHSDGNRETTGFLHVNCPVDHDYAGQPACDNNLNGPYTVDSLATKAIMRSCEACNARERAKIELLFDDVSKRVMPGANSDWDDTPEGRR